jgi:hypothetical protein
MYLKISVIHHMVDQQDKKEKEDDDVDITLIEEVLEFVQLLEEEKEEEADEEASEEEEIVEVAMKATVAELKDIAKTLKFQRGETNLYYLSAFETLKAIRL